MGVDARMFARHSGQALTPTEVRQLASRLAATLGVNSFMVMRPGSMPWYPEGRHALTLVPTFEEIAADDQEHAAWVRREAGGQVGMTTQVYTQDGPPILSKPGEQFIEVHLWTRFYGPGYERGDWPAIRATSEWLERHIPGCEVYYGGDSSGICAAHLDGPAREHLTTHYLTHGHEPYRGGRGSAPIHCDFCLRGMHDVGGGQGRRFWRCDGCDLKTITVGAERHDLPRDVEFFDWRAPADTAEGRA